jgi:hypothetical protein
MNIEQAKTIALTPILDILECNPARQTETDAYYLSPLREEANASFHVNKQKNIWYDPGISKGGNVVDFAVEYLKAKGKDYTVIDALRWLENVTFDPAKFITAKIPVQATCRTWELIRSEPLEDINLIRFLNKRGIPLSVGQKHLEEVYVRHSVTKNKVYALGFKNDKKGYELRNAEFKSCLKPKYITFIRGTQHKPDDIHLFEGFMDYLSFLTNQEGHMHTHDVIVLNSTANLIKAISYIRKYGYTTVCTWFDNDNGGNQATTDLAGFIETEAGLVHKPMNAKYSPHNDVNAWHMHELKL